MTTSSTPAKKRDASLERLQTLMKSPSAPGQEQAQRAVEKAKPQPKDTSSPAKKTTANKSKPKVGTKATAKTGQGKAQNMGLSLHPVDQDRLYEIENAVRKAGIRGRPSTSLLIKLAIAAFDSSKVENLAELYRQLESQDGRRKRK